MNGPYCGLVLLANRTRGGVAPVAALDRIHAPQGCERDSDPGQGLHPK